MITLETWLRHICVLSQETTTVKECMACVLAPWHHTPTDTHTHLHTPHRHWHGLFKLHVEAPGCLFWVSVMFQQVSGADYYPTGLGLVAVAYCPNGQLFPSSGLHCHRALCLNTWTTLPCMGLGERVLNSAFHCDQHADRDPPAAGLCSWAWHGGLPPPAGQSWRPHGLRSKSSSSQ